MITTERILKNLNNCFAFISYRPSLSMAWKGSAYLTSLQALPSHALRCKFSTPKVKTIEEIGDVVNASAVQAAVERTAESWAVLMCYYALRALRAASLRWIWASTVANGVLDVLEIPRKVGVLFLLDETSYWTIILNPNFGLWSIQGNDHTKHRGEYNSRILEKLDLPSVHLRVRRLKSCHAYPHN